MLFLFFCYDLFIRVFIASIIHLPTVPTALTPKGIKIAVPHHLMASVKGCVAMITPNNIIATDETKIEKSLIILMIFYIVLIQLYF